MRPERENKLREAAEKRQHNLTIVLENVHDFHNIGAVLRTCDAVALKEIFVLYTDNRLNKDHLTLGTRTSAGARKWVDTHYYTDIKMCFEHIRRDYDKVFGTHLGEAAKDLHDLDLTESVALVFGNEAKGLSQEVLDELDGNFIIPMMGMVQSLNISVACAVTLYEALRQRKLKGFYGENSPVSKEAQAALFKEYIRRHEKKEKRRTTKRIN